MKYHYTDPHELKDRCAHTRTTQHTQVFKLTLYPQKINIPVSQCGKNYVKSKFSFVLMVMHCMDTVIFANQSATNGAVIAGFTCGHVSHCSYCFVWGLKYIQEVLWFDITVINS